LRVSGGTRQTWDFFTTTNFPRAVPPLSRSNTGVTQTATNISPSAFLTDDRPPITFAGDKKIIQRILPRDLSDGVNECRMADADSELISRSQRADTAAFEELIRQNQRMVHALTYRMTGSLADAEDLAQETFIRAYEQIGSFRGTSKFSTWIYRIAVNTCINWRHSEVRRYQLEVRAAEELQSQNSAAENTSPAGADEVQAALLKLPAKQRAAVVLTIYDGLNHAEAAQILGCSETTVSWRVFAAKRKLKRLLTPRHKASGETFSAGPCAENNLCNPP